MFSFLLTSSCFSSFLILSLAFFRSLARSFLSRERIFEERLCTSNLGTLSIIVSTTSIRSDGSKSSNHDHLPWWFQSDHNHQKSSKIMIPNQMIADHQHPDYDCPYIIIMVKLTIGSNSFCQLFIVVHYLIHLHFFIWPHARVLIICDHCSAIITWIAFFSWLWTDCDCQWKWSLSFAFFYIMITIICFATFGI